MENVILVVHILACIGLIGVVLLQRSEGGGLGIGGGGGGGGGGLMSGRGAASALTRTTMILAAVFFATSLVLTTIATRTNNANQSIADQIADEERDDLGNSGFDLNLGSDEPADPPADDLGALPDTPPAEMQDDLADPVPDDLNTVPETETQE
ncbi:MAG: preprotein translocase subunit SecG [Ponticaulis sp.]|nr:preprotein translocase subunit SecG [Ponticaulis sp.]|tara:strand:- start:31295 stop:31753 length:459 start_codon:yes stop_codon:yes gene_type:complete